MLNRFDKTPNYMGPKFGVKAARDGEGKPITDENGNTLYNPDVAGRASACGGVYTYGEAFDKARQIAAR